MAVWWMEEMCDWQYGWHLVKQMTQLQNKSFHHHHHHLSFNHEGRWCTTDDFATSFLHFPLFSTALWDMPNSRPVQSLMLSSHLFLRLPCLFPPFTVPCEMVLARPDERETWQYHCSLRLFTMVRSSCGPIACWILARTSSLITWSLYEMRSMLQQHLISMACILLLSPAVRVHDSQAYRKMDVTTERIIRILELREILLSIQLVSALSMLLLSVLSWRVSQAWNPHHLQLSPGIGSLWLSQATVHSLWSLSRNNNRVRTQGFLQRKRE